MWVSDAVCCDCPVAINRKYDRACSGNHYSGCTEGSPTLCLLFIIFVSDLIKTIKEGCEVDGLC